MHNSKKKRPNLQKPELENNPWEGEDLNIEPGGEEGDRRGGGKFGTRNETVRAGSYRTSEQRRNSRLRGGKK